MGAEMNRVVITPLGQSPKIVYNVVPDSQLNAGKFVCECAGEAGFPDVSTSNVTILSSLETGELDVRLRAGTGDQSADSTYNG
jgi:hypothetical protein